MSAMLYPPARKQRAPGRSYKGSAHRADRALLHPLAEVACPPHLPRTPAMDTLKSHQLTMTVLMTPDMANFSGKVHGGAILKLLDQVAYACGSRYAGRYVVTLSVDQVMFRQAINVGELVTFLASVNHTGTSSMEIGIKVVAEDIRKQSVRHANSCFFTMVAVDDEGRTTAVPPLEPSTPEEIRRFAAARLRRQLREEMERRHAELGSLAVENA